MINKLTSMTPLEWRFAGGNDAVMMERSDALRFVQYWGNAATGRMELFVEFPVERGPVPFSYRMNTEERYSVVAGSASATVTFVTAVASGFMNGRNGGCAYYGKVGT